LGVAAQQGAPAFRGHAIPRQKAHAPGVSHGGILP
jgi:hypothetical protein